MKKLISILSLAVLWPLALSQAQVFPPNPAGVAMGHVHMIVRDVEANKKMFVLMGGTAIKVDEFDVVKFLGVLVFLSKGEPTGNNQGSVVDHFGFMVPDVHEAAAKWKASGVKLAEEIRKPGENPNGRDLFFVGTPDGQRLEINEDPAFTKPIESYHIHYWVVKSALPEIRAWYADMFGAASGNGIAVPGMRLSLRESPNPTSPTKGRVIDHIGFEVKNLDEFCKKLEAKGVKFDMPYSKTRHKSFASAQLTDPWGTSIELTEGLNKF